MTANKNTFLHLPDLVRIAVEERNRAELNYIITVMDPDRLVDMGLSSIRKRDQFRLAVIAACPWAVGEWRDTKGTAGGPVSGADMLHFTRPGHEEPGVEGRAICWVQVDRRGQWYYGSWRPNGDGSSTWSDPLARHVCLRLVVEALTCDRLRCLEQQWHGHKKKRAAG